MTDSYSPHRGAVHHGGADVYASSGNRFHAPEPQGRAFRMAAMVNLAGAALSLALVAGLGWWSWQLIARDVTGVPVVRALEGPMRALPEDAGGQQAAFQGLSVNEIPAGGGAGGLGDQIVLAPAPLDLDAEDLPQAEVARRATGASGSQAEVIEAAFRPDDARPAPESAATPPPPESVTVLERSPLPLARPDAVRRMTSSSPAARTGAGAADDMAQAVASSVASRTGGRSGIDIDPATLQPGMRLVQLGTYPSVDAAHEAWDVIAARYSPLLDERGRVIEQAHSGGSVFFRLRAHGFDDESDARNFCTVLLSQNNDCIPVRIR